MVSYKFTKLVRWTASWALFVGLLVGWSAAYGAPALENGGFEATAANMGLLGWEAQGATDAVERVSTGGRDGSACIQFRGSGDQVSLRQSVPLAEKNSLVVTGYVRADDLNLKSDEYIRLYVHVLYADRPESERSHFHADFEPQRSGQWHRLVVPVTPDVYGTPSEIRVTVLANFREGLVRVDDVAVQPLAAVHPSDQWQEADQAKLITDLSTVEPASALSDMRTRNHWKVIGYETETFSGKAIAAMPNTVAPPVQVPLNASGWHAVYLGMGGVGRFSWNQVNTVRVKLTGDEVFESRIYSAGNDYIDEVFFTCADLTSQDLVVAQQRFEALQTDPPVPGLRPAVLKYVKLVPLSSQEVENWSADMRDPENRRLIGTLDGFSWMAERFPTTKKEFIEQLEPFRHSDFGEFWWQPTGTGLANFESEYATIPGELVHDYPRAADEHFTKSIKAFTDKGIDLNKLVVDTFHDMDRRVLIGMRAAAWQCPPQFEDYFTSEFYRAHPEWRCYDRDGTPVMRMSFAVPEVQNFLLDYMEELLQSGADGVAFLFCRGLPIILWEDAFCERFEARYGVDAKAVPEDDPRLYAMRCEIITEFLRKVRAMLDRIQQERGQEERLTAGAITLANESLNRKFGFDPEQWAEEGLVDTLTAFPPSFHATAELDLDYYMRITKDKDAVFYPFMIGWRLPGQQEVLNMAFEWYERGCEGIVVWDPKHEETYHVDRASYFRPVPCAWPVLSRLGHVEEVRERLHSGNPVPAHLRVMKYGVWTRSRWMPDVGF